MFAGSSQIFIFPNVTSVTIAAFGSASLWVTGTYPEFTMSPSTSESGDYPITFVIVDASGASRTASIVLKVHESLITEDDLNGNNSTNATGNENVVKDASKTSQELEAKIKAIYIDGMVKVQFTRDIVVPSGYSTFDNSILLLEIESTRGKVNYTWIVDSID